MCLSDMTKGMAMCLDNYRYTSVGLECWEMALFKGPSELRRDELLPSWMEGRLNACVKRNYCFDADRGRSHESLLGGGWSTLRGAVFLTLGADERQWICCLVGVPLLVCSLYILKYSKHAKNAINVIRETTLFIYAIHFSSTTPLRSSEQCTSFLSSPFHTSNFVRWMRLRDCVTNSGSPSMV